MTFRYSLQALTLALSLGTMSLGAVQAQTSDAVPGDAKLSAADQQFVQDASQADATEIAASKVALKNSSDPHVKKFAQQMITDHTRLARNMSAFAAKRGLGAPPAADSALVGKLQTLKGTQFDQAYIEQVALEGHQKAVDLFQKESESGTDPQLKAAATHALPTIKHHLAMAQQLATSVKGSS
jgi:putative membrane protein